MSHSHRPVRKKDGLIHTEAIHLSTHHKAVGIGPDAQLTSGNMITETIAVWLGALLRTPDKLPSKAEKAGSGQIRSPVAASGRHTDRKQKQVRHKIWKHLWKRISQEQEAHPKIECTEPRRPVLGTAGKTPRYARRPNMGVMVYLLSLVHGFIWLATERFLDAAGVLCQTATEPSHRKNGHLFVLGR